VTTPIYFTLAIQILAVAIIDFRTKKISNIWPIINILALVTALILLRETASFGWENFLFPLGFLLIGFGLFLLKIMGPGDSKYLFSLFLLVPLPDQQVLFFCLIYVTIIVGSILLLLHLFQNFGKIKVAFKTYSFAPLKGVFGTRFTFAPLIFLAWIWYGWKIGMFNF
jgi:prepilin peptidase CpaA